MISYLKLTIFVTFATLLGLVVPINSTSALDFDEDGISDFVLVNVNNSNKLEWYAIDLNDTSKRSLGEFGEAGNHLALGNWSGTSKSSRAVVIKKASGDYVWNVDLSGNTVGLTFGSYPSKVISGLDFDKNGVVDPAVVTAGEKTLAWKVMLNPTTTVSPTIREFSFGSKNALTFYANHNGSGDQLAAATVNKKGELNILFKNISNSKVKRLNVRNYKATPTAIFPVALPSGQDSLFAVSKQGTSIQIAIIQGKKIIKRISTTGDEIVVGKYINAQSEVVAIRNGSTITLIDPNGAQSEVSLELSGILADDININTFSSGGSSGGGDSGGDRAPRKGNPNPRCSGTAISTEHLLYKPVSDTMGTTVIVFDSKYTSEFVSVQLELKDGSFAEGWWKGLVLWGNPDSAGPRQHWRTNVRAAQVKDGALIIANDGTQECRFVIPGSANRRWE